MSDADTKAADEGTDKTDEGTDKTDQGTDKTDEEAGTSEVVEVAPDPERTGIEIEKPARADQLSAEELEEIRQERLDPENRPDNVEVDNTQRDFDTNTGKFTDSEMEEDVGPFDDDAV